MVANAGDGERGGQGQGAKDPVELGAWWLCALFNWSSQPAVAGEMPAEDGGGPEGGGGAAVDAPCSRSRASVSAFEFWSGSYVRLEGGAGSAVCSH